MKLQDKISVLRKKQGLSQEELAEKLNISRQTVSRWELGSSQPEASNVFRLSLLFGVSADFLLNDELDTPDSVYPGSTKTDKSRILGICISAFGLLGNFIIYILSRFKEVMIPVTVWENGVKYYTWRSDITDYSYRYFIREYNLEFLTAIFRFLFILGIIVVYKNRLLPVYRKISDKTSSFMKKFKKD